MEEVMREEYVAFLISRGESPDNVNNALLATAEQEDPHEGYVVSNATPFLTPFFRLSFGSYIDWSSKKKCYSVKYAESGEVLVSETFFSLHEALEAWYQCRASIKENWKPVSSTSA